MTALPVCHGGCLTLPFHLGPFAVLYIPPSFGSTKEPGQCKAWKGHHQQHNNLFMERWKNNTGYVSAIICICHDIIL